MSYDITWQAANDRALTQRVTAAIGQEAWRNPALADNDYAAAVRNGPAGNNTPMVWAVATAADVNAAYASAVAAGNPDPGGDPSVITDEMILGVMQADWPTDPT